MPIGNPQLARILKERGEPEEILRALVDGGVLLVSNPDGSVLVGQLDDDTTAVAAFTSPDAYAQKSDTEEFTHADAAVLLEIAKADKIHSMVVDPEGEDAALIPLGDVMGFLFSQGQGIDENTEVAFRPSQDPGLPELKTALAGRFTEFPAVERVWISEVRMSSGIEGTMLHVVLTDGSDPEIANQLLQATMEHLPESNRPVFAHLTDPETEQFLGELKAELVSR